MTDDDGTDEQTTHKQKRSSHCDPIPRSRFHGGGNQDASLAGGPQKDDELITRNRIRESVRAGASTTQFFVSETTHASTFRGY